jgi:hypothetical protein
MLSLGPHVCGTSAANGTSRPHHEGAAKPRFDVSFDALARNFGVVPSTDEILQLAQELTYCNARCDRQDDRLMREDEVLALVGEDHKLIRDLSGGSFGNLFSDEASRQELAMAMANLTDEVVRSPSSRAKSAAVRHLESGSTGSVPVEVAGFEGSQTAAATAVLPVAAAACSVAGGVARSGTGAVSACASAAPSALDGWLGVDPIRLLGLPVGAWPSGASMFGFLSAEPRVERSCSDSSGLHANGSAVPSRAVSFCLPRAPPTVASPEHSSETSSGAFGVGANRTRETTDTSDVSREDDEFDDFSGCAGDGCECSSALTCAPAAALTAPPAAGLAASLSSLLPGAPSTNPSHAMPRTVESSAGPGRVSQRERRNGGNGNGRTAYALPSAVPRVVHEPRVPMSVPLGMGGSSCLSLLAPNLRSLGSGLGGGMSSGMGGGMGGGMGIGACSCANSSALRAGLGGGLPSTLSGSIAGLSGGFGGGLGGAFGLGGSLGSSLGSLGSSLGSGLSASLGSSLSLGSTFGNSLGNSLGGSLGSGLSSGLCSGPGSSLGHGLSGALGIGLSGALSGGFNGALSASVSASTVSDMSGGDFSRLGGDLSTGGSKLGGGRTSSCGSGEGGLGLSRTSSADALPPPSRPPGLSTLAGTIAGLHPSLSANGANATLLSLAHEAAVASAAASAASALSGGRSSKPTSGAHVAAAAAASAASRLIHAEAEASGAARGSKRASSINRRTWSAEEDDTIRVCVEQMGMRWREIAPLLPGRSDDSVRNRWKRLKEEADAAAQRRRLGGSPTSLPGPTSGSSSIGSVGGVRSAKRAASEPPPAASHASKRHASTRQPSDPELDNDENGHRVSWSPLEDQVIVQAVQELGPRWCSVAARLPSRTDQAVRNRWNRLQQRARVQARTMLNAFQVRSAGVGAGGGDSA